MTVNIGSLQPIPGERLSREYLEHLKEVVNTDFNPVHYLGIDPGKSNGVCGYDEKCHLVFMLVIQAEDINLFLHQFKKIKTCVTEGYRVFPNKLKDHIYSDLETPRVIGRIESWAELHEVELVMQPSSIKTTGYKWIGEKPLPKSNKLGHAKDGHVHFTYWAVITGRIKMETLLRKSR